ncbi:hypothetical protein SELMODRAFT_424736 [Selaginella moellendorffii]|uniref:Uncharacterized protein n=1 Tax=Selaginella moellendorffii TaxID=88036 RepID=D8SQW3_SELML|nr:hypothetical protein SELMODRAFT_424736 [Selaginella moellendorffii]
MRLETFKPYMAVQSANVAAVNETLFCSLKNTSLSPTFTRKQEDGANLLRYPRRTIFVQETASQSGDHDLAEELLSFFIEQYTSKVDDLIKYKLAQTREFNQGMPPPFGGMPSYSMPPYTRAAPRISPRLSPPRDGSNLGKVDVVVAEYRRPKITLMTFLLKSEDFPALGAPIIKEDEEIVSQYVRVVKETDLKSVGFHPRRSHCRGETQAVHCGQIRPKRNCKYQQRVCKGGESSASLGTSNPSGSISATLRAILKNAYSKQSGMKLTSTARWVESGDFNTPVTICSGVIILSVLLFQHILCPHEFSAVQVVNSVHSPTKLLAVAWRTSQYEIDFQGCKIEERVHGTMALDQKCRVVKETDLKSVFALKVDAGWVLFSNGEVGAGCGTNACSIPNCALLVERVHGCTGGETQAVHCGQIRAKGNRKYQQWKSVCRGGEFSIDWNIKPLRLQFRNSAGNFEECLFKTNWRGAEFGCQMG